MDFVKAAKTGDIAPGAKQLVVVGGREVMLVNVDGTFFAVANRCPHMGGSLSDGKLEGAQITCPRHGSVFDVTTGKVVERGTLFFLKVKVGDVQTYPVKVDGEDVLVGAG